MTIVRLIGTCSCRTHGLSVTSNLKLSNDLGRIIDHEKDFQLLLQTSTDANKHSTASEITQIQFVCCWSLQDLPINRSFQCFVLKFGVGGASGLHLN